MPPKATPKKSTTASSKKTPGSGGTSGARTTRASGSTAETQSAVQKARARTASKHTTPADAARLKQELSEHKKRLKEIKAKHTQLKQEHESLREDHGVAKVTLEETAAKLTQLQKVHEKLKEVSDSHAGASVDSLSSYKGIVEDHSSKLGTAHNDLQETLGETLRLTKEIASVQAEIASLRKSNAALRAAVNDNELAADETDAALERAVTDCENSVLQLRTVEAELDEANAEQETTAVELDICQQQVDDLLQRARAMAVESASSESARGVELEHGRALVDAMRKQLEGLRDSQNAAESESADLRIEAAENDLKLELLESELASKTASRDEIREALSAQVGSLSKGSVELRTAEAHVRELEEKLASYAAIEVELQERRAREKVTGGLKVKLEEQLQQLRGEATKLRESTVSAKQTVTDTLKGKLSAVQAKNKVKEELVATVDELRRLQGSGGGDEGEIEEGDATALETANAKNIDLQSQLDSLEAMHARLSAEVGALG